MARTHARRPSGRWLILSITEPLYGPPGRVGILEDVVAFQGILGQPSFLSHADGTENLWYVPLKGGFPMGLALALVVVVALGVGIALLVARLHGGKIPRF